MAPFKAVIADFQNPDGRDFQQLARRANELGMTHVLITKDLPLAKWQDDYPTQPPRAPEWEGDDDVEPNSRDTGVAEGNEPGSDGVPADNTSSAATDGTSEPDQVPEQFRYDPYPSWFTHHPGLLKVAPPEAIQPHISQEWVEAVTEILERRCEILRRHDLKGAFATVEPQVLPEEVFVEHPQWRGPRVDQPNRARKPHFAPCVTRPEVQELYREAVADLLEQCPEIELFQFKTTDAGSGFCWAESLYPGKNGNSACRDRSMTERVTDFFDALEAGADEAGVTIEYNLVEIPPQEWMVPTFNDPEGMAADLHSGQAINDLEGPDATPFKMDAGTDDLAGTMLYPVTGLPQPIACVRSLQSALSLSSIEGSDTTTETDHGGPDRLDAPRLEFSVPECDRRLCGCRRRHGPRSSGGVRDWHDTAAE